MRNWSQKHIEELIDKKLADFLEVIKELLEQYINEPETNEEEE